jgi:hypothetical protein
MHKAGMHFYFLKKGRNLNLTACILVFGLGMQCSAWEREPEPPKTKTSQPFPGISHVHQLFINKKKRLKHIDIRSSTRYLE